ncbi:hypothetical protein BC937DRAFT_91837 [Endogone sp. FLAS-F59071]|nr:hypothetical protein BC937DRAFT_91837 [Endogone sp. FLAS-F59071]|eukprot:RUS23150.1 hypothetical protein BC937DRAFT_91837 [Endogone sp. FLAS-F59071]
MSDVNHNEMGPVGEPEDNDKEACIVPLHSCPSYAATVHQTAELTRFLASAVTVLFAPCLHEIHHADHVHHLHETDKLKHISAYKLILVAREEVSYGINYFGKVHLGDDKYVHVRCHKSHEGKIDFYSLHATRDSAIWTLNDPLVYFNE